MITDTTILLIVMWVVCTAISMTGMICKRNIDVVSIMSITLIVTIFVMFFTWWKIYFKGEYKIMKYKTLKDTVDIMCSTDYKERFISEYKQLEIRILGLERMLDNWDHNELNFKPTCPRSTYDLQLRAMKDYYAVLQMRAVMENIPIDVK